MEPPSRDKEREATTVHDQLAVQGSDPSGVDRRAQGNSANSCVSVKRPCISRLRTVRLPQVRFLSVRALHRIPISTLYGIKYAGYPVPAGAFLSPRIILAKTFCTDLSQVGPKR